MMIIETHVHTRFSPDSILPLWFILVKCKIKKINYIAITDHNTINGAIIIKKIYKNYLNKHNINVIVGEEVMTSDGEIIGLYLSENIMKGLTPEDTVNEIIRQGGLVYIPHPYDKKREKTVLKIEYINKLQQKIDCIECYNGRNISTEYEKYQTNIANQFNIPKIVGSDSHTIFEIGRNYNEYDGIQEVNNTDDFRQILSHLSFHKRKCHTLYHRLTVIDRIIKMPFRRKCSEMYRVIFKRVR